MTKTITANAVRTYFRADAKRFEALSPEAQKTVAEGARGRLHPDAIKAFNVKRRKDARYVSGNTLIVTAESKAKARETREAIAAKGIPVGKRGRLSKTALEALAPAKKPRATRKPKAVDVTVKA